MNSEKKNFLHPLPGANFSKIKFFVRYRTLYLRAKNITN